MGIFDFFKGEDINEGFKEYESTENAVLVDVREVHEYQGGHMPGAINIPLSNIEKITSDVQDKEAPLFVYCLSGARSSQAANVLQRMGYSNVKNIGGISGYTGALER